MNELPENLNSKYRRIGLGGGCHWCTEAVFQSLKGVIKVEQGWIESVGVAQTFSEAVIVYYNPKEVSLSTLIKVHLQTHSSTSNHAMRKKYRSAIYYFSDQDQQRIHHIIDSLQSDFENKIVTKTYPFRAFKASPENFQNYFTKNPNKPFCQKYISPKIAAIELRIKRI